MKFFGERSSLTAAARVEWEAWNVNDAFGVSFLISRRRRLSHVAGFSASQREARQSLPLLDFVFMRSNKISILCVPKHRYLHPSAVVLAGTRN